MANPETVVIRDKEQDRIELYSQGFNELSYDANGEIDIDDLRSMDREKLDRLRKEIGSMSLSSETKNGLQSLLAQVSSMPLVATPPPPEAPKSDAVVPPPGDKENGIEQSNLPIAPVTTFNIIRLIQLGYVPINKPGTWKSPKWVFYGPTVATQYVNGKVNGWMLDWTT